MPDESVAAAALAAQMFAPHHTVSGIMVTNNANVTVQGGFATAKVLWSALAAAQMVIGPERRCVVYFEDGDMAGSYHPGVDELPGMLLPSVPDEFKELSIVPDHQDSVAELLGFDDIRAVRRQIEIDAEALHATGEVVVGGVENNKLAKATDGARMTVPMTDIGNPNGTEKPKPPSDPFDRTACGITRVGGAVCAER